MLATDAALAAATATAAPSRTSRSSTRELTAFRRDLHAHPELGFEEVYTAAPRAGGAARCAASTRCTPASARPAWSA